MNISEIAEALYGKTVFNNPLADQPTHDNCTLLNISTPVIVRGVKVHDLTQDQIVEAIRIHVLNGANFSDATLRKTRMFPPQKGDRGFMVVRLDGVVSRASIEQLALALGRDLIPAWNPGTKIGAVFGPNADGLKFDRSKMADFDGKPVGVPPVVMDNRLSNMDTTTAERVAGVRKNAELVVASNPKVEQIKLSVRRPFFDDGQRAKFYATAVTPAGREVVLASSMNYAEVNHVFQGMMRSSEL